MGLLTTSRIWYALPFWILRHSSDHFDSSARLTARITVVIEKGQLFGVIWMKLNLRIVYCVLEWNGIRIAILIWLVTEGILALNWNFQQVGINVKRCVLSLLLCLKTAGAIWWNNTDRKLWSSSSKNLFNVMSGRNIQLNRTEFSNCLSVKIRIQRLCFNSDYAS